MRTRTGLLAHASTVDSAVRCRYMPPEGRHADRNGGASPRTPPALRCLLILALGAGLVTFGVACGGSGSSADNAADVARTASPKASDVGARVTAAPSRQQGLIVFRRWRDLAESEGAIFIIAPDGSGERQIDEPPLTASDDRPDFAVDGSLIAFERCNDICRILTVRPDGTGRRRVGGCRDDERPPRCYDVSQPAIAPNARRIAFVRAFGGSGPAQNLDWDHEAIYTMRMDGSHPRRVTRPRASTEWDGEPQWSPDGQRIVFVRRIVTPLPAGRRAVFTVNADGTRLRRVTPWSLHAGDGPNWSPDGTQIVFRSPLSGGDDHFGSNLYTIHPDGSDLKQITHVPPTIGMWSAGFSPDGAAITFGMTGPSGKPDVYTMRRDGTAQTPVTRTPPGDSAPDWGAKAE